MSQNGIRTSALTTAEVSKMAQISLRQLQWLDEKNIISPQHEGHRRWYSPNHIIEIMAIAELRRKGFSLQKIRSLQRMMHREVGKRLHEILSGKCDLFFLTDGESAHFEARPIGIIDALKKSTRGMCLVSLGDFGKALKEFQAHKESLNDGQVQLKLF